METSLYQVNLKDGRQFRIFCANQSQLKKFNIILKEMENKIKHYHPITHGIHNFKQWEEISKTL